MPRRRPGRGASGARIAAARRVESRRAASSAETGESGDGDDHNTSSSSSPLVRWFPVISIAVAVIIAAIMIPRFQRRAALGDRLMAAVHSGSEVQVRDLIREAGPRLVERPYIATGASPLWLATRLSRKQRAAGRRGDRMQHLHFPTPLYTGGMRHAALAIQLAEAGADYAPLLLGGHRYLADEACISRVLPLAKVALPRHFARRRGELQPPHLPVGDAAAASVLGSVVDPELVALSGSAVRMTQLMLEGSFHFTLYGMREFITHGFDSKQFQASERRAFRRCGVSEETADAPTWQQVICTQQAVLQPMLELLLPEVESEASEGLGVYDRYGQSLVHLAAKYGDAVSLQAVLDAVSVDVNARTAPLGQTALHMAASKRFAAVVQVLLDAGADPAVADDVGYTAGAYAQAHGFSAMAEALSVGVSSQVPGVGGEDPGATRQEAGGWRATYMRSPALKALAATPTTVTVAATPESITPEQFLTDFAALGRPLLVRGGCAQWGLSELWSRSSLETWFGSLQTPVSWIPHGYEFGVPSVMTNVSGFVEQEFDGEERLKAEGSPPLYLYARNATQFTLKPGTLPHMPEFMEAINGSEPESSFALGAAWSGSPMHLHGPVWHGLVHGLKLWWLLPPNDAFYTRESPMTWHQSYAKRLAEDPNLPRPLTAVLGPGDILHVPDGWSHAVLNLADSVAVSVEYDSDQLHHHY